MSITEYLKISLIDDVSKPARTVAQALREAEKAAESVAKGMGKSGSDPFRRQLASLKLTANELRDVRKEWLLYARAQKQAMGSQQWAMRGQSVMLAREKQILAAAKASKREQLAAYKATALASRGAGGRLGGLGGKASDFASWALPGTAGMALGMGGTAAAGLAVGGTAAYGMKKAIDFNKAMAEVKKKVNLDQGATYADVENMINKSARTIGIAREEVAGLVAQAGQAGIEFKDLAGFMDLTTKGAVAFDIPARDMAQKLAEIKAGTQWSNKELGDFVDKVNMLGDTGASAERDIVEMFGRSAAAAKAANVPLDTTLAVTTALNSIGMQPEVASRFWNAFSSNLRTLDGKDAAKNLKDLGLSLKQVQDGMKSDKTATPTILKLLEALDKSPEKARIGQSLFGKQWWDEAARSGQALPEIIKNLQNLMNTAKWKGSADQALNLQLETTANHLERIKALASEVGDSLARWALPGINSAIDSTIKKVEEWMHPKGPSTAPGSLANYEARNGLGDVSKPAETPPPRFSMPSALSGRGRKGAPPWAMSPLAGPMGSPGGISPNHMPAFGRMQGAPSMDLGSVKAGAAQIDIVGTALQKLNTTVTPTVNVNTGNAISQIGDVEGKLQTLNGTHANPTVSVNTGNAVAELQQVLSLLHAVANAGFAAQSAAARAGAAARSAAAAAAGLGKTARGSFTVGGVTGGS